MQRTVEKLLRNESITQSEHDALVADLMTLPHFPITEAQAAAYPSRPIKIEG